MCDIVGLLPNTQKYVYRLACNTCIAFGFWGHPSVVLAEESSPVFTILDRAQKTCAAVSMLLYSSSMVELAQLGQAYYSVGNSHGVAPPNPLMFQRRLIKFPGVYCHGFRSIPPQKTCQSSVA